MIFLLNVDIYIKRSQHLLYGDKKLDTAHSTYGTEAQGNHPSLLTVLAISTYHFPKVLTENQSRLLFSNLQMVNLSYKW